MTDFYEGITEGTTYKLERLKLYADLALKNGDIAYMDGKDKLVIEIRKPRKEEK